VNFGSQGVMAAALPSGMSYIEIAVGQSKLGAVAWWAFGIGGGGVA